MITPHEEYQESDQYVRDFFTWFSGTNFEAIYQASPEYADNYQRWLNDQNDEATERRRQADRDDHLIRGDE